MSLQAAPEDRAVPDTPEKKGLMARLLGLLKFGRRKKAASETEEMLEEAATAMAEPPAADGDIPADAAPDGMDAAAAEPVVVRQGAKHKLMRVLRFFGLILWPPFLRGDLTTVNRRLLTAAWSLLLIAAGIGGGWLIITGQSLTTLPGSEVVIAVGKLALPPEARLAPDQKPADQAQKAAMDQVGRLPSGLLIAPDPALVEAAPGGQMPKIGADGRQPWRAYARPFEEAADRPRLALVLGNLGLNEALTAKAAEILPPAVTFAFSPYAPNLAVQIENARRIGHEVLLQLPMEPFEYPANDPGPYTLLTTLTDQENARRLDWLLTRATGYIGFTNYLGGKFTSSPEHMKFVGQALKQRGLMFVDARTAPRSVAGRVLREGGGVYAISNRQIDQQVTAPVIESRLDELERLARAQGVAVGYAAPYPVTLDRLVAWSKTLGTKSFVLAPVSAVVNRQTPE